MKQEKPFSAGIIAVTVVGLLFLAAGLLFLRLEITSRGEGRVAARSDSILHAPRTASIEAVLVRPSDRVEQGAVLMVLRSSELEGEWLRLQEAVAEARLEKVGSELKLRELALTGGMAEAMQAEAAQAVLDEIAAAYEDIEAVYASATRQGLTTRIQELEKRVEGLRGQLQRMENTRLLTLKASGLPELLIERETARLEHARARVELLERQIALREREREELLIRAAHDGWVTDIYARHPGQRVEAGEALLTLVRPEDGYEVKAFVEDRNVDLIQVGMPVRLESKVYQSNREGYMWGTVSRVVTDTRTASRSGFEVTIVIDTYPIEPVIGSRVEFEIIITDGNPLRAFFNHAPRARPMVEEGSR